MEDNYIRMYRSNKHWGNHLWLFIHIISIVDCLDSKDTLRISMNSIECLKSLGNCIPCHKCREEWKNGLAELDTLNLSISMELFRWSWRIHNKINKKLDKPEITYEEAISIHCIKI